MTISPQPLQVLIVESNPADSYLMVEGLRRAGLNEGVTVLEDSEQALSHICGKGRPDLIFLDLNLTPMPGLDVLERIRSNPKLACVPVIIVSGSQNSEDVRRAYESGANCYVTKPGNLEDFLGFMKILYQFWGSVATLPREVA